jgi:uncharacterized C2H2 Zn-finger protein
MKSLLPFLLLIISSQTVSACECFMTSIKEHIKSTPYLVTGKVIGIIDGQTQEGRDYRSTQRYFHSKIDTLSHGYAIRFLVQHDFKGSFKAGDIVEISSGYTTCDMLFDAGKDYILFLHKEQGVLFNTPCSYSEKLDGSKYSNDVLRTIQKGFKKVRKS